MFEFPRFRGATIRNDLLSGLTVALALVPEAVAFAFVAGVQPLVGLYAACIVGLITAIFGGRPGMISGATGALAVVMVSLVAEHGLQYLFATVILMGIIQVLSGALRLGKLIRIVPHPVMLGFVNGLAIVIFLSQLEQFKVLDSLGNLVWMDGIQLYTMLGLVGLTMAIIHFLPKLTTTVPASLVAILSVTAIAQLPGIEAITVIDFVRAMSNNAEATIAGGLPNFDVPNVPFTLDTLKVIFPYAVVLAAIGLIESLLTLTVVDEMTGTRGRSNRECIGQGIANITTGFFGGMGGCAMIGQSMINIRSGGRSRLSGITAALTLLGFILFGASLIEVIPVAALVGVMFMVVLGTFEWATLKMINKVPKEDFLVMLTVTVVTVFTDLAVAVFVGVVLSSLMFSWTHAKHISVATSKQDKTKVYILKGTLFFGSASYFLELFDAQKDPEDVIIDFGYSRVIDLSAIEAIDKLAERYMALGKTLHLQNLSPECQKLLRKAGDLCEVSVLETPHLHTART